MTVDLWIDWFFTSFLSHTDLIILWCSMGKTRR